MRGTECVGVWRNGGPSSGAEKPLAVPSGSIITVVFGLYEKIGKCAGIPPAVVVMLSFGGSQFGGGGPLMELTMATRCLPLASDFCVVEPISEVPLVTRCHCTQLSEIFILMMSS